jgi:hypothetical protein
MESILEDTTMVADGSFKLDRIAQPVSRFSSSGRFCGFCGLSLQGKPPVLLKSGESVHLDCYLLRRKRLQGQKPN